jgi:ribose transport system permease protein
MRSWRKTEKLEMKIREAAQGESPMVAKISKMRLPTVAYTILLLLVVGLLFRLGNENFLSIYNLNTIVGFAAVLLMVALGQMCAILIGGIDLSVGGLISFISVVFTVLVKPIGYWVYPICLLIGLLFGFVNGFLLTRVKIPSFIATLGTGGILSSLALLVSGTPVNVPASTYSVLDIVNGSFLKVSNVLYIAFLVFVVFSIVLRLTTVGRKIFYVGSNIKMSWMSGIDVALTRNIAFMLSGLGASIAGIMITSVRYGGDPVAGQVYVLKSIAAVVVGGTALTGGTGGPANTLFGTLLMSVLDNGMNVVGIDPYFQQSILGMMIIVSVVLTFERGKTRMIK